MFFINNIGRQFNKFYFASSRQGFLSLFLITKKQKIKTQIYFLLVTKAYSTRCRTRQSRSSFASNTAAYFSLTFAKLRWTNPKLNSLSTNHKINLRSLLSTEQTFVLFLHHAHCINYEPILLS